jgi:hypothetical protein
MIHGFFNLSRQRHQSCILEHSTKIILTFAQPEIRQTITQGSEKFTQKFTNDYSLEMCILSLPIFPYLRLAVN